MKRSLTHANIGLKMVAKGAYVCVCGGGRPTPQIKSWVLQVQTSILFMFIEF